MTKGSTDHRAVSVGNSTRGLIGIRMPDHDDVGILGDDLDHVGQGLFFGDGARHGVVPIFDHGFLAVLAEHEADELAHEGIQGLTGGPVDVHIQKAGQGVCAGVRVVRGGLDARRTGLLGQQEDFRFAPQPAQGP